MTRVLLVTAVCCLAIANLASAMNLNPPPWRGEFCTTWQGWEFDTPDPAPPPDGGSYPYGEPEMDIVPGPGMAWLAEDEGMSGVWPLSGEMSVKVYNHPLPRPTKEIWVQLVWRPQEPGEIPVVTGWHPEHGLIGPVGVIDDIHLGGGWIHCTYVIEMQPNPEYEIVGIRGNINVDELIIDTRCVPAPAALPLLALGGLLALRKRRS